jgi:hypothetical protein
MEQPFLKSKAFGALAPIGEILLEKLIESSAVGSGTVSFESFGTGFPFVFAREFTKPGWGASEHSGSLTRRTRGWEL